jgi:GAF domain-containing protein
LFDAQWNPVSFALGGEEESLDASLHALAGILFAGRSAVSTLEAVAHLAQRTIPGCDAASVTIMEGGKPQTTVSTAEIAVIIDRHQYATDEGPCLEAMRTQTVVRVDSFDDETRWPRFVPEVRTQGVHSSLSLPLVAVDSAVGALNLYSWKHAGFLHAEPVGTMFAAQAAITLANATAYHRATELARNLALALEHRDMIGQAKGILIAQDRVSSEEAFDILRRASQRSNRKVYDLAAEIVVRNTGRGPAD